MLRRVWDLPLRPRAAEMEEAQGDNERGEPFEGHGSEGSSEDQFDPLSGDDMKPLPNGLYNRNPSTSAPALFETPARPGLVIRSCKEQFETGVFESVSQRKEAKALYRIVTGSDKDNDTGSLLGIFMDWQKKGCLPFQLVPKVHLKKNCIVWTTNW